jgi:hypothetical protein
LLEIVRVHLQVRRSLDQTAALLHGREEAVFADAGDTRADKQPQLADRDVSWNIAGQKNLVA